MERMGRVERKEDSSKLNDRNKEEKRRGVDFFGRGWAVIRDFVYVGKPKSKLSMRWASFGLAFLRNPAGL